MRKHHLSIFTDIALHVSSASILRHTLQYHCAVVFQFLSPRNPCVTQYRCLCIQPVIKKFLHLDFAKSICSSTTLCLPPQYTLPKHLKLVTLRNGSSVFTEPPLQRTCYIVFSSWHAVSGHVAVVEVSTCARDFQLMFSRRCQEYAISVQQIPREPSG